MQLTQTQQTVVTSQHPLILVLAVPGAGKTRVLIERIRRLIEEGVNPKEIIAITFTNAAARELLHRLSGDQGTIRLGFCGTLHALMTRVIRMFSDTTFSVIDEELAEEMLQEVITEMKYKDTREKLDAVLKLGPARTKKQFPTAAENTASRFFHRLRQENLFTFDMLLTEGLRVLKQMPQDRWPWKFLFVDEIQDSGNLDEQIYQAMPVQHRFFIGDASQSIYKFRGGRMENILKLAARPDVEVHHLNENFRSDANICLAAQTLMRNTELPPVIRSQSGKLGQVRVTTYDSPGAELYETCQAAGKAYRAGEETAILVRNNDLVSAWVEQMESLSLPILRRKEVRPKDWRSASDCLTLLCNPNNDWAAYRVLCRSKEKEHADQMRLLALTQFTTINQLTYRFPQDMSAESALQFLRGMIISAESMALFENAFADLDSDALAPELALACMRLETGSDTGKGITIKTLHSAKGLEFDTVFLPAFEEEIIPGNREDVDVGEERRVAYVGITRARHHLFISYSAVRLLKWDKDKELKPRHLSRFVTESGLVPSSE